jgi:D-beta-D-heptose 7-phosphate kinase/D-beta-D-heptose 1-phosphate adenosyltransferase
MQLPDFTKARILVVGDIMIDHYVTGRIERLSPEAPVPVFVFESQRFCGGGAANVANNVAAIGAEVTLCGVTNLEGIPLDPAVIERVVRSNRHRTAKTRFMVGGQQVFRSDLENDEPYDQHTETVLQEVIGAEMPHVDAVIVSDYGKGVVTRNTFKAIVKAKRPGQLVFVDPKRSHLSFYQGADWITPNRKESLEATLVDADDDEAAAQAAQIIFNLTDANVLLTRAEHGMTVARFGSANYHIRSHAREVFDVSGAGDTVIAVFASAIAAGCDPSEAAEIANVAAGIVVGKRGTATVTPAEMHDVLGDGVNLVSVGEAAHRVARWRAKGERIGFTNGCFDILHHGHVHLLEETRKHCDRLIVGLNSDQSVRELKGDGRPVNGVETRAKMLTALNAVDLVVVFDKGPMPLIMDLRPDVLSKGADYDYERIVGAPFVSNYGGKVLIVESVKGVSSSAIIERTKA